MSYAARSTCTWKRSAPSRLNWPAVRSARSSTPQAASEAGQIQPDVVIKRCLPAYLRADAAALFEEAFGDKLRSALPSVELMAAALERALRPDHIVAALREDQLVGMVGLSAAEGQYQGGVMAGSEVFAELRALLGWIGGIRAVVGLAMGQHRPEQGELYVDGIAVTPSAQGSGIGTRLLGEVLTIAGEGDYRAVRLDVVDTNPRAQQLYERLGYKVTNVQTFGYLRRFVGFGGMTTMELRVPRET